MLLDEVDASAEFAPTIEQVNRIIGVNLGPNEEEINLILAFASLKNIVFDEH